MPPGVIETEIADIEAVDILNEQVGEHVSKPHEHKVDTTNVRKNYGNNDNKILVICLKH